MRRLTSEQVQQYVAANVRRLRSSRGLTQSGLAEAAGLSLYYVQEIEAALKAVSLPALVALANALDVSPPDLLQPAMMPEVKRGRPRTRGAAPEPEAAPAAPAPDSVQEAPAPNPAPVVPASTVKRAGRKTSAPAGSLMKSAGRKATVGRKPPR